MKSSENYGLRKIKDNLVPIIFTLLCIISIKVSGQGLSYVVSETVNRITRNTALVVSLILPVLCGMGLNFSIVLGAISAQFGLTLITHWNIGGLGGILLAFAIATVLAVIIGYYIGRLFNRVKGQEMITGMILGFAAIGAYDILCIFMLGSVIPMYNPEIMLQTTTATGEITYIGLRNTIELHADVKSVLDKVYKMPFDQFLLAMMALLLVITVSLTLYKRLKKNQAVGETLRKSAGIIVGFALCLVMYLMIKLIPEVAMVFFIVRVPMFTVLVIALICALVMLISKTKLGQDIKTVGYDMRVATAAGINVDRTRIIATVLSTMLAAWGQIIYLQNIGNIQTYNSHEQVGTYAVAALLVGGASLEKATIGQAITGTTLFHILFFITPLAGAVIFADAQYGEYFRVFLCYGIIAISLALYSIKKNKADKRKLEEEAMTVSR